MSKILWDDEYLRSFVKDVLQHPSSNQFWEFDENDEVVEYKDVHYRRMVENFLPALGVWNLNLGDSEEGTAIRYLVFLRDSRCQVIDAKALRTILNKVFMFMGSLGDELKSKMIRTGKSNPIYKDDFLENIPEMYDKKPFVDTALTAYRFFENGYVEITKNGVSPIRSYGEIPDEFFVWNSNVIPRKYNPVLTKQVLEAQLTNLSSHAIHPHTGDLVTNPNTRVSLFQELQRQIAEFEEQKVDTHFQDFVENLSRGDDGEIDEATLERLRLAAGYLCHRHHVQSKQRAVILVDKFHPGRSRDTSEGGTGKSLFIKCLGGLMNRTEVNGKKFEKGRNDLFPFGNVKVTTELVHIDDVTSKMDFDRFFNHITGDFEIRKMGRVDVIPAKQSPKIAICSNHPVSGDGNSYSRRQFLIEVSNYYRELDENEDKTPFEEHGYKHLATDDWSEMDWSMYYEYAFGCIAEYLKKGGLPKTQKSAEYARQQLLATIGSSDLLDFFIDKLSEYSEHGEEVFVDVFYKEVRSEYPEETNNISNQTLWEWFGLVGKAYKMRPNNFAPNWGKLYKERLSQARWSKWCDEGMEFHVNTAGNVPKQNARVQVFKVCSLKNPGTMFQAPNFNRGDEVTPTTDGTIVGFFEPDED